MITSPLVHPIEVDEKLLEFLMELNIQVKLMRILLQFEVISAMIPIGFKLDSTRSELGFKVKLRGDPDSIIMRK